MTAETHNLGRHPAFHGKALLLSLALPLAVGALSGFLTKSSMGIYSQIQLPRLAPPPLVFPFAWTILFLLMGLSAYRVLLAPDSGLVKKTPALKLYLIQLAVNFVWPLLFFNLQSFLAAFLWLVLLWCLILAMIYRFGRIDTTAAWLQVPYLLWVFFAGYLNLGVYLLNR